MVVVDIAVNSSIATRLASELHLTIWIAFETWNQYANEHNWLGKAERQSGFILPEWDRLERALEDLIVEGDAYQGEGDDRRSDRAEVNADLRLAKEEQEQDDQFRDGAKARAEYFYALAE